MKIFVEMTEEDFEDWKKIKKVLEEKREGLDVDELKDIIKYHQNLDKAVPKRKYGPDCFNNIEKPIWPTQNKNVPRSGKARRKLQMVLAKELCFRE